MAHVVVVWIRDANRARQVDATLRYAGARVRSGVYEVVGTPAGLGRLERELGAQVRDGDLVRIYPVCGRCRRRVRLYGEGELAQLPLAWIW